MTILREAAQQALEEIVDKYIGRERDHDRLDAIRAVLSEPVQEPVAWESSEDGKTIQDNDFTHDVVLRVTGDFENDRQRISYAKRIVNKLNAAPPQRKPLMDEEIYGMYSEPRSDAELVEFAREIERAHGIGGSDE